LLDLRIDRSWYGVGEYSGACGYEENRNFRDHLIQISLLDDDVLPNDEPMGSHFAKVGKDSGNVFLKSTKRMTTDVTQAAPASRQHCTYQA
jgi:hypothetical protein